MMRCASSNPRSEEQSIPVFPFPREMAMSHATEISNAIVNIAAYKFTPLDRLEWRRDELKQRCYTLGLKGTILISREGMNLFLAGERSSIDSILQWIRSYPGLSDIPVKESVTDYQPFNRMLVRIKKEIIPVGLEGVEPVPNATPKITPEQLKQWLDEKRPIALLDTRNDYEVALGTFQGAVDLNLKIFRQFPAAAAALPDTIKKNPVVMFCTGGIRCEKIGPFMNGLGFEQVYQLEGGILKYFEECEHAHYDGECFVFDQRVAVDPQLGPAPMAECFACRHVLTEQDLASDRYEVGRSCPYCFQSDEERRESDRVERQATIRNVAAQQLGCTPYENRRWLSIPQRAACKPLIDALSESFMGYCRKEWESAIANGHVRSPISSNQRLESIPVEPDRIVREGERFLHVIPNYVEPPINPDLELVYQDQAIVVINKSAPLPLHPSGRFNRNTLESILMEAYRPEKLRPTHRLDANTTGLVVFARKYSYAPKIQSQFAAGTVQKTYLARVDGVPAWDSLLCELPIGREPLANGGRAIDGDGQWAATRLVVLERSSDGTTIVAASPMTGRTHQIRLHLAALGFPIINDPLYLSGGSARDQPDHERQREPMSLHAWRMEFEHPTTGARLAFQADCRWYDLSGIVALS